MINNIFCKKLKGYFYLIRPFTFLVPLIISASIMIASFFYNNNEGTIQSVLLTSILPASLCIAILNGGSNALNQATDIESDRISKPYRPIPKGYLSKNEAILISLLMYLLSIYLATMISFVFFIIIIFISFFTITYSLPPRLKNKLFINQLWIALPRGLFGILASWSVFGDVFQPLPIIIGLIAMFFLIGGSITKDITDCEADKKTGTSTLVNTFGLKKSALISFPFMFFPFTFIPILISNGILDSNMWFLTFIAIPSFLIFLTMVKDKSRSKLLENTSSWSLMYITYLIFSLSFSILIIAG